MAAPRAIAGYAVNKLSSPFYTSRVKLVMDSAENMIDVGSSVYY